MEREAVRAGGLRLFRGRQTRFDPKNLLESRQSRRLRPISARHCGSARITTRRALTTAFDFSAQGGFARAVEMCSGVGACRKTSGGTMCPSYMVTHDEMHTTRGRANALRLVMSGTVAGRGLGERDAPRSTRPLPAMQGMQE